MTDVVLQGHMIKSCWLKENLNQQRLFEVTVTASQEQIVVELTECCNIKIIAKYLYASISKCLKLALDP